MNKKDEIKDEIWNIWQINLLAKECFSYAFYFNKPDTKEELNYLNHAGDFHFIRLILWKMTVVELSKLFKNSSNSDRYNIFHFISKLKKGGHFGKMGISAEKISFWEEQIEENSNTITEILKLRDKLYSHTDVNSNRYKVSDITFEKTEKLILIVESIIHEIYSTVFDSHPIMNTVYFNKQNFNLIKVLAYEKERRMKELFGDYLKGID